MSIAVRGGVLNWLVVVVVVSVVGGFLSGFFRAFGRDVGSWLRRRRGRFDDLTVPELQQLTAATYAAEQVELFSPGPGNLLPRLREEIGEALNERLRQEGE